MTITASSADNVELHAETYFSIGGGFVVTESEQHRQPATPQSRLSFGSAKELLELANHHGATISELMLQFESEFLPVAEIFTKLLHIRDAMEECEQRGICREGTSPGRCRCGAGRATGI